MSQAKHSIRLLDFFLRILLLDVTFQVTDMMVANATNLIITVKPASQKNNIQKSYKSDPRYQQSNLTNQHHGSDSDSDGDEVRDLSQHPDQSEKLTI